MKNTKILVLIFILVLAAIVRLLGINFGLPHALCRPDEETIVAISRLFFKGDFNPHFHLYPAFFMYFNFLIYWFFFVFCLATGRIASVPDWLLFSYLEPSFFYLVPRLISAFLGTFSVFVVYRISRALFTEKIALISALFLALAYLHVRDSHFGVTDITATFFILCSVYFIVEVFQTGALKNYFWAGLFAGVATATKYLGVFLILPLFLAHFFRGREDKVALFFSKKFFLFLLCFLVFFLFLNPYFIKEFPNYYQGINYEFKHLKVGPNFFRVDIGWWYHLKFSLFYGLGVSLLAFGLFGLVVVFRSNFKKALVLLGFPLTYYLFAGQGYTVFVRYAIPLVPFLCITGAVGVDFINRQIISRFKTSVPYLILFLLVLVAVIPLIEKVWRFDSLLMKKDSRLLAVQWLYENVRGTKTLCQQGAVYQYPYLQFLPKCEELEIIQKELKKKLKGGKKDLLLAAVSRKIARLKENQISGFELWDYDRMSQRFIRGTQYQPSFPDYLVITNYPHYAFLPLEIRKILVSSYVLKNSFIALDVREERNLFDVDDDFYLPFAGYFGLSRPGPNIYIFEKK
jgi:4-amino-4-deoxy-L-arabinose transferase-like glycosyltransferase